MNPKIKNILEKLLVPLLISGAIFGVFYFGGDAYKSFGVAAVDSTTKVLKYILGVIAFLSLGVLFNRIIRYVIFEGIVATATGAPVPKLLTQISSLLIFIVTVAACASVVFNQDLTILWAASGVAGLVLGMALRELLQDVFAGIALNIDRSVRIGDFVQIHRAGDDKILGQLMEVSWRSTHVKDNFGDLISFPNSKFSAYTITNFSASDSSGRTISVTIDGRVPTERAMRILQAAALDALIEVSGPNTALPTVGIKVIKNDGIEYIVSFEVAWELLADATWQIQQSVMRHLARAGLKPAGHKAGDDPAADSGFVAPDEQRLIALIGATRIFSHLGPDELAILTKNSTLRFVQPDRVVVQTGEAGNELYLVVEGLLRTEGYRQAAGRAALPAMLRPGDLFDAAASLLGTVHRSTVRSRTPALLCEISSAGLHELFNKSPETIERIARDLAECDGGPVDEEKLANNVRQIRHLFPPSLTIVARR